MQEILVVEDDLNSVEMVDLYLLNTSFKTERTQYMRHAFEFWRAFQPSLALHDISLPQLDGF